MKHRNLLPFWITTGTLILTIWALFPGGESWAATGIITTVTGTGELGYSGDGGQATKAKLNLPSGVFVDLQGNLFVVDTHNHRIRRVDGQTGIVTTIAGTGQAGFSGDWDLSIKAELNFPSSVFVDTEGNIFIADSNNHSVRRIDRQTGIIATVAGTGEAGFSGDGGKATEAMLNIPSSIFVDSMSNLFIADTQNHRIRRVDGQTGLINTIAGIGEIGFSGDGDQTTEARLFAPEGVFVDPAGNIFIADKGNNRVRRVDRLTGIIGTVAGGGSAGLGDFGKATEAWLWSPTGVFVDAIGNLFIADSSNHRIRRVDGQTGLITTVAGTGEWGFSGEGGKAVEAVLAGPNGVFVDSEGNLLIADRGNNRIRRVEGIATPTTLGSVFTPSVVNVLPLAPNPNPPRLTVMLNGVGYLYYRAVDVKMTPVRDMIATYTVNGGTYSSKPTDENGVLIIPVETTGFLPGEFLNISITHMGSAMLTAPITARVAVIPRSYQHVWGLGKSIAGKVGVAVGRVYIKGETEAGISYALNEKDELVVGRTAELGLGGGIGVSTPGAKLTIGATQAGALAEAHAEIILYRLLADEYLFSDRHEREQQMAQSALFMGSVMYFAGAGAIKLPFIPHLTDVLIEHVLFDYEDYRTKESVALGAQINAGASAFAGISIGGFTSNGKQQLVGMSLQGDAGLTLGAEVEHIKYYEESAHVATGYAMSQMLETELNIAALLGNVMVPAKQLPIGYARDDVYASAGMDFGKSGFAGFFAAFGIDTLSEFREEYIVNIYGEPLGFLFSIGNLKWTITFIVAGEDIADIQQSVANLAAFLDIAMQPQGGEVQIGRDAIVTELRSLLGKLATLSVTYVVTEGTVEEIRFSLSLSVGGSFEIEASESIDRTTLEGVFLGGIFFPQASYADHPKSSAELASIINDALKGSWEIVKDKFRRAKDKVVAGAEAVVEAVVTTVEGGVEVVKGSAKLVAKFSRDLEVELVTWGRKLKELVTPAPAGPMTKYQQALAQAMTPVVGGYYQFAPEGETFVEPGTLTISYTDDEITQLGINEASLRISYWHPTESRWISVGGKVNTIDNSVTATITALHLYAITFDATPPGIGQLVPRPDSVITDPRMAIRASIVDDTDQLDTSSIVVLLDNVEVFYIFDGEFVIHAPTSLSVGNHTVTVKASDLFGNMAEQTWSFTLRNPAAAPWDVDGNGIVDMSDLMLVGSAFGMSIDETPFDLNSDGEVNIVDLIIVAMHYGETTDLGAPSAAHSPSASHVNALERWLRTAKAADDGSEIFRRGITVLERLLSAIIPEQTALLQNFPNPFNPDTWIPYQLSDASEVSITIYDATGRIIKSLELGYKSAGIYRTQATAAHWDGRNETGESVASGVYFALLKAGEYQQIRRMVLVK